MKSYAPVVISLFIGFSVVASSQETIINTKAGVIRIEGLEPQQPKPTPTEPKPVQQTKPAEQTKPVAEQKPSTAAKPENDSIEAQIDRINKEPFVYTSNPPTQDTPYTARPTEAAAPGTPQKGSLYIVGNNRTAIDARKWLVSMEKKNRGCLTLSPTRSQAQLILELAQSGDVFGRNRITGDLPSSAQLLRADTGDVLWAANSDWGGSMLMFKLERWACHK